MAADNTIKRIFRMYLGKHFSRSARNVFGRWLKAETDREEKEQFLFQYWQDSAAEVTDETIQDWEQLKSQLYIGSRWNIHETIKYAAVIGLFIASVGGTYWTAVQTTLRKPVEMAELFVPYGETRAITLPDSSKVWVNAGSTVVYPKDFEGLDSRSVYLSGLASFSVTKNREKPFIVRTAAMDVQALGTEFIVEAYPDQEQTKATLEEGKVRVSLKDEINPAYILKPSEQLVYSRVDQSVKYQKVDIDSYRKLRNGYLIFKEETFQQIISVLQKKYAVTIQYNASRYRNSLYNLKFTPDETIEDVMETLQQLVGIRYKIDGNQIIIQ